MYRLRSKDGATILIGLLFFLLCAVAGTIVLAAGTSAAGRVSNLAAQEQSYYSITSAAKIIISETEGKTIDFYKNGSSDKIYYYSEPDSKLKAVLETASEAIYKGNQAYSDKLTIKVEDNSLNKTMGIITGKLSMDRKYNIEIVLSSDVKNSYTCKVVIPAAIQDNKDNVQIEMVDEGGNKITRTETKLIWSGARIERVS